MHKQNCTQKMIAKAISKHKSVISRELKRNANLFRIPLLRLGKRTY
ncbi:MAG: helix-turn-helix domain-containing protein [Tannerella sp.]|nr:helix-turn-helix domain-containing protein [Tannerella sp.]